MRRSTVKEKKPNLEEKKPNRILDAKDHEKKPNLLNLALKKLISNPVSRTDNRKSKLAKLSLDAVR